MRFHVQLEVAALTARSACDTAVDASVDYVAVEGRSDLSSFHEAMPTKDAMLFMQSWLLLYLCPQRQNQTADEYQDEDDMRVHACGIHSHL